MSLDTLSSPSPGNYDSFAEAAPYFGFSAMREIKQPGMREEIINGHVVNTNLPEGMLPFEPVQGDEQPQHPFQRPFLPSAIDSLPVGEFAIKNPRDFDPYFDRKIVITDPGDGKRINRIDNGLFVNSGKNTDIMTALGYQFEHGVNGLNVASVPTPETIKAKAGDLGVDIQFFADQTLIAGEDYLAAFANGKYPISTKNSEYYIHDTQDDHLTAMVLGGEPLKTALRIVAAEALLTNADADEVAAGIDEFTAYLRGVISPTLNHMTMEYNPDSLRIAGQRIGLKPEEITGIIDTAKANAVKFGMELKTTLVSDVSPKYSLYVQCLM